MAEQDDDGARAAVPQLDAVRAVEKATTETDWSEVLQQASLPAVREGIQRVDLKPPLDAFVLSDVVLADECQELVARSEKLRYSFWNAEHTEEKQRFRNADTVEVHDPALAKALWERVQSYVVPTIEITPDDRRHERGLDGTWRAVGINEHMLYARYGSGGHFSPHTDGYTVIDLNTRTLYTALVYLNTCAKGGATRMMAVEGEPGDAQLTGAAGYDGGGGGGGSGGGGDGVGETGLGASRTGDAEADSADGLESRNPRQPAFVLDAQGRYRWPEDCVFDEAKALRGSVLFFSQDLCHEGEPVGDGAEKYIIRTDVVYARDPPVLTRPQDQEAYTLFRQAELLEADDPIAAASLFRRAFKLSPALADLLGM